ncbi:TatD family hydrolase [Halomonas salinarum]|uniref:TatD family hydrolase n=1 Tax=Halomonas salinarum TaxID=1158993 RepID=UPI00143C69EB|nr:TatD family hydrolase [Halomonas salinarum]
MLIDAHCHLDFPDFDVDRDAMFERANAVGVEHFVVPGTTRARWSSVLALGQRADVSVCLGLHPYFLDEHCFSEHGRDAQGVSDDDDLVALEEALDAHPEVVALGECGIDARFEDTLDAQWALFKAQLRIAKVRHLPVVIHCVRANDQVAKCLKEIGLPAGGLIHAFAGSLQQAQRFLELGFVLGLGGAMTHQRAKRLRRCVADLPTHGFVLETDSPDMPPAGFKGLRNEPARLAMIADEVATLQKTSRATLEELTTANAARVFNLAVCSGH